MNNFDFYILSRSLNKICTAKSSSLTMDFFFVLLYQS